MRKNITFKWERKAGRWARERINTRLSPDERGELASLKDWSKCCRTPRNEKYGIFAGMCLYWTATVHLQQQMNSPSTYYLHLICTVQKTFEDDLGLCRAAAHSDARSLAAVVSSNLSYHWPFTSALLTFDDFFCDFIIRPSLGHL